MTMDVRHNQISLNKIPAFRSEVTTNATPPVYVKDLTQQEETDKLEKTEKQEKTGFIQKFKNGVASVRKFFISTNTYVGAAFSGALKGGLIGMLIYAFFAMSQKADKAIDTAKTAISKATDSSFIETLDDQLAKVAKGAKPGFAKKAASIAAGLAVFGFSLYRASLNVSDKKSDVDHRYTTGHNK